MCTGADSERPFRSTRIERYVLQASLMCTSAKNFYLIKVHENVDHIAFFYVTTFFPSVNEPKQNEHFDTEMFCGVAPKHL